MNKSVRNLISGALVLSAFGTVIPAQNFGIGMVSAEASTYKSAGDGELSSLNLYRGSGSELKLQDSFYGKETYLSGAKDYYVVLNGSEGIDVNAEVAGDGYVVKVFDSADKEAEGKDPGDYITVENGVTNIYLRTYRSEDDYRDAYDDKNVNKKAVKTYVIHVKKSEVVSDEELNAEEAYLQKIYLSDGDIDFDKNKYSYNINVKDDVEELVVRAKPIYNDYTVDINDTTVDENDDYETTVKLDKGNNTIKIKVESDDDDKTYTLNVNRGGKSASDSDTDSSNSSVNNGIASSNGSQVTFTTGKANAWNKVNGKWQYLDGTGQSIKSKWWYDSSNGKSYYLDSDGYMKTSWLFDNNNWYYLSDDGSMKTGWQNVNGKWYYLNAGGAMITGWADDSNGSWYYFDENGAMVTDTIIDGYSIGSDGVML